VRSLIFTITFLAASSVFAAASVSLRDEANHETKFFKITSIAFSLDGIELRVQGKPVCVISSYFLKQNNISGLDLKEGLLLSYNDDMVECEFSGMMTAVKIRPHDEP
jgi:hypothetical protein